MFIIFVSFVSCQYSEFSPSNDAYNGEWKDYSSYEFGMAQKNILSRTNDNYIKICDNTTQNAGNALTNNMWSNIEKVCGFEAEIKCGKNLSLVGFELHPVMTAYASGNPIDWTSYDYYHFYLTNDGKFVIKFSHYDTSSKKTTVTTIKSFLAAEAEINKEDFNNIKVVRNIDNSLLIYINQKLLHIITDNNIKRYGKLAMDWQLIEGKKYSESFEGIGYVKVKTLQILNQ